ncbi:MAG: hypothetical protein II872_02395 [Clostridia bacterium]|nr:hypothetical protein [Clostridia bacterium]
MKKKEVLKVISVVLISALLILFFSRLLTPTWYGWNNDNMVKGFYREPNDRLQAVFVGTSQSLNGISPMELYRRYGICAYNLSSEQQPLLASLYWIKEVERLHGKTLQTVVLDLSFVFHDEDTSPKLTMNEKALTHMRFSGVKAEAYRALAEQYGIDPVEYIVPLIRYHSRWSSVTLSDLQGLTTAKNQFYTRGQNLSYEMSHDIKSGDDLLIPNYAVTEEINRSQSDIDKVLNDRNLGYVDQIAEFCREKDLDLIFIKIAKSSSDTDHDALQYLADRYGVPLIDFNLYSVQQDANLDFPYDYWDEKHPNIAGAQKITDYIGKVMVQRRSFTDARTDPAYDYMKEQAEQYRPVWDAIDLISGTELVPYLNVLKSDRYSVFLSVKGDAAEGLTDYEKDALTELGFSALAAIGPGESYLGVRSRGAVLLDERGAGIRLIADGTFDAKKGCTVEHVYRLPVKENGGLKEAKPSIPQGADRFSLESGGRQAGNLTSIVLSQKNRADDRQGVNIVVYDHVLERIVDTSCFDMTSGEPVRSDTALPYRYHMRLNGAKLSAAETIGDYILTGSRAADCTMILCGTMGWEKPLLTEEDKEVLAQYGIDDGSFIEKQPFILIIQKGTVLLCKDVDPKEPLEAQLTGLINVTVTKQPKKDMTLRIGNDTYTIGKDCIYVIAYNGRLGCVMNERYLRKMS